MTTQERSTALRAALTASALALALLLNGCKLGAPTAVSTPGNGTTTNSPSTNSISSPPQSNHQSSAITLSWLPPTQNTNGSTLTDLAGYYIDWGTQSGEYSHQIQVANPGLSSYVVDNLSPGTYYFAVQAYSSSGEVSSPSAEVSAVVQ